MIKRNYEGIERVAIRTHEPAVAIVCQVLENFCGAIDRREVAQHVAISEDHGIVRASIRYSVDDADNMTYGNGKLFYVTARPVFEVEYNAPVYEGIDDNWSYPKIVELARGVVARHSAA